MDNILSVLVKEQLNPILLFLIICMEFLNLIWLRDGIWELIDFFFFFFFFLQSFLFTIFNINNTVMGFLPFSTPTHIENPTQEKLHI